MVESNQDAIPQTPAEDNINTNDNQEAVGEEPRGRARGGARRGGPPGSARGGGRGRGRGGRGGIQTKTLNEMFSNIQKNHARQFGLGQTKTLTEDDIEARSG